MSRNKMIRVTVGGVLLAMALTAGISAYHMGKDDTVDSGSVTADNTQDYTIDKKVLTMPETENQTDTAADPSETAKENDAASVETAADDVQIQTDKSKEATSDSDTKETAAGVSQFFTEDSIISWPVEGTILLDYSMDETTYFSTLNVYKCNPAILIKAEADEPVCAACAGTVKDIYTSAETGDTVVVDMGNGYEATYGQLKDITVSKGDSVQKGAQIGKVCEPTKYYRNEGTNLYFGMTKDDQPVDPAMYTASSNE